MNPPLVHRTVHNTSYSARSISAVATESPLQAVCWWRFSPSAAKGCARICPLGHARRSAMTCVLGGLQRRGYTGTRLSHGHGLHCAVPDTARLPGFCLGSGFSAWFQARRRSRSHASAGCETPAPLSCHDDQSSRAVRWARRPASFCFFRGALSRALACLGRNGFERRRRSTRRLSTAAARLRPVARALSAKSCAGESSGRPSAAWATLQPRALRPSLGFVAWR